MAISPYEDSEAPTQAVRDTLLADLKATVSGNFTGLDPEDSRAVNLALIYLLKYSEPLA